tara:strand:- start:142 stop:750 length:609 start_codon:yes stop_codon:yes gene_type:complete
MNKFGEFFEGEWQNVLIKSVLILVVFLILLRIIRKELGEDDKSGKNGKKENKIIINRHDEDVNLNLLEQVCNGDIATLDGSDGDARDVNGNEFTEADAESIALGQYDFMQGWGSSAPRLIKSVSPLNGRALQMVACKFGIRQNKNIWQWYNDELWNPYVGGVYYANEQDVPDSWMPGCESWWKQCKQLTAMKSIWQKAGISF